ncbi:hypothetical protein HDU79_004947, partial [Rhizoclosmatium sp. JEL0117]
MHLAGICSIAFLEAKTSGRWSSDKSAELYAESARNEFLLFKQAYPGYQHPVIVRSPWNNPNPRQIKIANLASAQVSLGQRTRHSALNALGSQEITNTAFYQGSMIGRTPYWTFSQVLDYYERLFPDPWDIFTLPGVMLKGVYL